MVALQSGELGLLPEDWLRDWAVFGELGRVEGERLRFGSSQVGLLDALLRSRPQVRISWRSSPVQTAVGERTSSASHGWKTTLTRRPGTRCQTSARGLVRALWLFRKRMIS